MIDLVHNSALTDTIRFYGHPNIRSTHYNTIEVTRASEISTRADCIIGVGASKACIDLTLSLRNHIQKGGDLLFTIIVEDRNFDFLGKGMPGLSLVSSEEIVFRRSHFLSDRTAAISCNAAAIDLPRDIVRLLQSRDTEGLMVIRAADLAPHPN